MKCENCGSNELVEMNDLYNSEKDLTDGQESEALAKEFNGEVEFECLNCNHTQFEKIYNTFFFSFFSYSSNFKISG